MEQWWLYFPLAERHRGSPAGNSIALAGSGVAAVGFFELAAAAAPADIQLNVFRKGSRIGRMRSASGQTAIP